MLSVVDLEKLDIPPMLDETKGLYDNSILTEKAVLAELALEDPAARTCSTSAAGAAGSPATSRPRPAARSRATTSIRTRARTPTTGPERCDMTDRLHFKVDNHHDQLDYPSETFDGCFSFQAVWPFFKKEGLDLHAREMYRVLKPGARYACSEYLLTPFFDWDNEKHVALHRLILPTLAATQSMHPADVCAALERAGFRIVLVGAVEE